MSAKDFRGQAEFIAKLELSERFAPIARIVDRDATSKHPSRGVVDGSTLLSFVDGVSRQNHDDVLYSVQLAQRAADRAHDRYSETPKWYLLYAEVMTRVGWTVEQFAFSRRKNEQGIFKMDASAVEIIEAIASQNQLAVLKAALSALGKLADKSAAITLFDFHAAREGTGNFQLGSVEESADGTVAMASGAFHFRATEGRKRFLFFNWGEDDVEFWVGAQKMTLNTQLYARLRDVVRSKLGDKAELYLADLDV